MNLFNIKKLTKLCAIACSVSVMAVNAQIIPSPPKVNAKGYFLVDFTTGKVITEGKPDTKLAPASLTKMMTSYIIGTEIAVGNISLDDKVTVSEKAWAKNFPESSKMFIEVGKQVTVEDLNKGIIVQSGNDACVAMSEHIAGSESAFADLMNAHAEKLGMTNTHFVNSHGLDTNEHYTTPRDMATLGAALIKDVPEEYAIYKQKSFTFNGIKQYNRNSLLWDASLEVDGIKTGHTSEAGYSLVTSAKKGDMRLISVVMGTNSERARQVESKKLLNYGFRFFETVTPYTAGDSFVQQRIWMGNKETVSLGILEDTPVTIPRGQHKNLKATFELDGTLEAPLQKGTKVGTLFLQLESEEIAKYPLVTLEEVEEGSFFSKIYDYLRLQLQ
jgi:serine-type D-Ala-D-Ala carboxypeptidase (penicillin-binding protein 5/6)